MNRDLHRLILAITLILGVTRLPAQTYFNDDAGRLVQVSYPGGNGIRYIYDDADNLTGVQPISLPGAPTNLRLDRLSATDVKLSWNDSSSDETGFVIMRREIGNNDWIEIALVGPNVTQFLDDMAEPGVDYAYRVAAEGTQGLSAYSNVESTATNALIISAFGLETGSQGQRMKLTFPTVSIAAYRIEATASLEALNWQTAAFSATLDGVAGSQRADGTGALVSLYVETPGVQAFYRVVRE